MLILNRLHMYTRKEMLAFDKLPLNLRDILNYSDMCIDPRFVLGMYKDQGIDNTLSYLDAIGLLPDGGLMSAKEIYGS